MIDAHCHIGTSVRGDYLEDLKEAMELAEVKLSCICPSLDGSFFRRPKTKEEIRDCYIEFDQERENEFVYKYNNDRLLPFCFLNPFRDPIKTIKRGLENGIVGIKLNGDSQLAQREIEDALILARESGLVTFIHPNPGDIISLKRLIKKHSDLSFLIGHLGADYHFSQEIAEIVKSNDNVYLETSTFLCGTYSCLVKYLETVGSNKLIFGSDFNRNHPLTEKRKFDVLELRDYEKRNIFEENIKELLSNVKR